MIPEGNKEFENKKIKQLIIEASREVRVDVEEFQDELGRIKAKYFGEYTCYVDREIAIDYTKQWFEKRFEFRGDIERSKNVRRE